MTELIAWRFLGGMGAGLATTVSPMYIAEVAPARLRGRLVVLYQLSIVTGLFLSVCITYLLSFGGHWRWMFATQGVPVVVLLAGLLYVPESPRWLATVGQYTGAIRVLTRINGSVRAEKEIQEIQSELREESGGFGELLHPGIRTAAILGIVLMVFLQINGVNMILIYAPTLFMEARSTTTPEAALLDAPDAILNSVYIAAWITLCTVFAIFLAGRFNRRSLLICGAIVMAFGHALMFLSFIFHMPALFILSVMLVPTGAYTLLLAPTGWVVLSEILPNRIRGKAMSLTTCAMYAASYATTHLFPMMMKWFEKHFGNPGGTWLVFMGVCLTGFLFIWRFVPETKDKTLEEISAFWIHKGRRSAGQCMHEKGGTA
jgi:sugar porter (SP) family MFS transporter